MFQKGWALVGRFRISQKERMGPDGLTAQYFWRETNGGNEWKQHNKHQQTTKSTWQNGRDLVDQRHGLMRVSVENSCGTIFLGFAWRTKAVHLERTHEFSSDGPSCIYINVKCKKAHFWYIFDLLRLHNSGFALFFSISVGGGGILPAAWAGTPRGTLGFKRLTAGHWGRAPSFAANEWSTGALCFRPLSVTWRRTTSCGDCWWWESMLERQVEYSDVQGQLYYFKQGPQRTKVRV